MNHSIFNISAHLIFPMASLFYLQSSILSTYYGGSKWLKA
jgi:hypothetical protein